MPFGNSAPPGIEPGSPAPANHCATKLLLFFFFFLPEILNRGNISLFEHFSCYGPVVGLSKLHIVFIFASFTRSPSTHHAAGSQVDVILLDFEKAFAKSMPDYLNTSQARLLRYTGKPEDVDTILSDWQETEGGSCWLQINRT